MRMKKKWKLREMKMKNMLQFSSFSIELYIYRPVYNILNIYIFDCMLWCRIVDFKRVYSCIFFGFAWIADGLYSSLREAIEKR